MDLKETNPEEPDRMSEEAQTDFEKLQALNDKIQNQVSMDLDYIKAQRRLANAAMIEALLKCKDSFLGTDDKNDAYVRICELLEEDKQNS